MIYLGRQFCYVESHLIPNCPEINFQVQPKDRQESEIIYRAQFLTSVRWTYKSIIHNLLNKNLFFENTHCIYYLFHVILP